MRFIILLLITVNIAFAQDPEPTQLDWGDYTDLTYQEPELDDTPTAQEILQPIIDWLQNNVTDVTVTSTQCPQPSFTIPFLSSTFTYSYHCDLFEQYRLAIASIMLLCWSIITFRITMSA